MDNHPWQDPWIQNYLDHAKEEIERREKERRQAEEEKRRLFRRYVEHLEEEDREESEPPTLSLPVRWGRLADRSIVLN